MTSAGQFLALAAAGRARRRDQWLAPERLRPLRAERLRRLAEAAGRTPYYRELFGRIGLAPADLDEASLPLLPLLEKATLHAAGQDGLLAEPAEGLFAVTTSGSTGQPLKVLRSTRDQAEISALWSRVLHAYGHGLFDSQVNV
ncbi:MAG TPA: hypothetical protein VEB59_05600, partial [Gemmatimonadales bacterium]|nr:hypothetical protein [Gemmatimonadales bacterium]